MPSLDGYSLNEEIKALRKDVFTELTHIRKSFRELYSYIEHMEKDLVSIKRKEVKDAKSKKVRSKVPERN
jgi:hypothetical protein